MEDDYGDRAISQVFYNGEISEEQKKIAKRTRKIIESKIGRFSTLRDLVGTKTGTDEQTRRANMLVTRAVQVQWIQGSASVAETSFFKINSQGTPLDEVEEMLIRNRRKPIAISARAILRAGAGHKYWSAFSAENQAELEELASKFYQLMFEPEVEEPLKTLEVSLGGSVSPVNALALLIEFLTIAGTRAAEYKGVADYADDDSGAATVAVLKNSLEIVKYITGNEGCSLGLHPAVYFYNEKGKYSRFLFLGMTLLLNEKVRNNDRKFFKKFTTQREKIEAFIIENKSLIGILLQNMSKTNRVPKMRDLLMFLVSEFETGTAVTVESMIQHLGLRGRIIDVVATQSSPQFSDDTKSIVFVRNAIKSALICPICRGKLDPKKSVSYDHRKPVRDGGTGDPENADLVHPYCNTGIKN